MALVIAVGHVCGYVGGTKEAVAAAEAALSLDSEQSEVLGYAGCALGDLRYFDRAVELLQRAIELNPANAQAWVALGTVFLTKGEAEQAVEALSYGLRISPKDPSLAVWGTIYSLALARAGRMDDAIDAARSASRQDPKLHNPKVALACLLLANEQIQEAMAAFEDALRLRPDLNAREIVGIVGKQSAKKLLAVRGQ